VDKEEASHLMSKLDWVQAVDEIKQAVDFLRADGASKVGLVCPRLGHATLRPATGCWCRCKTTCSSCPALLHAGGCLPAA
jgi:carboxymethylenebutenolidase